MGDFIGGRPPDPNALRRQAEIEAKAGGVLRRHAQRRQRAQEERFDAIGAVEKARELQRRLDELDDEIRRAPFGRREDSEVRRHFRELKRERNEVEAEFPPGHKPRTLSWLHESEGQRWTLTPQKKTPSADDRAFEAMVRKRTAEMERPRPGRRARRSGSTRREREMKAETRDMRGLAVERSDSGPIAAIEGYFAVFDTKTEINSMREGNFMEEIAPGAFAKTIADNRDSIRCLYNHGHDPNIGEKPLGPVEDLREDGHGAFYKVPLLDAQYARDIAEGAKAGVYGASFKFRAVREEFTDETEPSPDNPKGLPIRRLVEVELFEFGPTPFGAYPTASSTAA